MFARASKSANLTPAERAVLKLIEGVVLSALVAGIQAVVPFLATRTLTWADLGAALHTFAIAFLVSLFAALLKYAKAFGDPPLPSLPAAGPKPAPLAETR